jgi:chromosome segregation ATPase
MIEDWYSLDATPIEKKLEEKLSKVESDYNDLKAVSAEMASRLEQSEKRVRELTESLSKVVEELRSQQTTQSLLLEEVRLLRTHEGVKHTNDLLEEIRVLKQRELNLLLREKIPIPFFSSTETLLTKKIRL